LSKNNLFLEANRASKVVLPVIGSLVAGAKSICPIRINFRKYGQNRLISRRRDQYNNHAKKSVNKHFFNCAIALQLVGVDA